MPQIIPFLPLIASGVGAVGSLFGGGSDTANLPPELDRLRGIVSTFLQNEFGRPLPAFPGELFPGTTPGEQSALDVLNSIGTSTAFTAENVNDPPALTQLKNTVSNFIQQHGGLPTDPAAREQLQKAALLDTNSVQLALQLANQGLFEDPLVKSIIDFSNEPINRETLGPPLTSQQFPGAAGTTGTGTVGEPGGIPPSTFLSPTPTPIPTGDTGDGTVPPDDTAAPDPTGELAALQADIDAWIESQGGLPDADSQALFDLQVRAFNETDFVARANALKEGGASGALIDSITNFDPDTPPIIVENIPSTSSISANTVVQGLPSFFQLETPLGTFTARGDVSLAEQLAGASPEITAAFTEAYETKVRELSGDSTFSLSQLQGDPTTTTTAGAEQDLLSQDFTFTEEERSALLESGIITPEELDALTSAFVVSPEDVRARGSDPGDPFQVPGQQVAQPSQLGDVAQVSRSIANQFPQVQQLLQQLGLATPEQDALQRGLDFTNESREAFANVGGFIQPALEAANFDPSGFIQELGRTSAETAGQVRPFFDPLLSSTQGPLSPVETASRTFQELQQPGTGSDIVDRGRSTLEGLLDTGLPVDFFPSFEAGKAQIESNLEDQVAQVAESFSARGNRFSEPLARAVGDTRRRGALDINQLLADFTRQSGEAAAGRRQAAVPQAAQFGAQEQLLPGQVASQAFPFLQFAGQQPVQAAQGAAGLSNALLQSQLAPTTAAAGLAQVPANLGLAKVGALTPLAEISANRPLDALKALTPLEQLSTAAPISRVGAISDISTQIPKDAADFLFQFIQQQLQAGGQQRTSREADILRAFEEFQMRQSFNNPIFNAALGFSTGFPPVENQQGPGVFDQLLSAFLPSAFSLAFPQQP